MSGHGSMSGPFLLNIFINVFRLPKSGQTQSPKWEQRQCLMFDLCQIWGSRSWCRICNQAVFFQRKAWFHYEVLHLAQPNWAPACGCLSHKRAFFWVWVTGINQVFLLLKPVIPLKYRKRKSPSDNSVESLVTAVGKMNKCLFLIHFPAVPSFHLFRFP